MKCRWRFSVWRPGGRCGSEIRRPELIVHRHTGDDGSDERKSVAFQMTVTFEDAPEGKTLVTMRGVFPTAEERERVAREYGAVEGAEQTLARMAAYVAAIAN